MEHMIDSWTEVMMKDQIDVGVCEEGGVVVELFVFSSVSSSVCSDRIKSVWCNNSRIYSEKIIISNVKNDSKQ
jgi:hypothetical protein